MSRSWSLDVDCSGLWSNCTSDCAKVYDITTPKQGNGNLCEAKQNEIGNCVPGEGQCPITCANYQCQGEVLGTPSSLIENPEDIMCLENECSDRQCCTRNILIGPF